MAAVAASHFKCQIFHAQFEVGNFKHAVEAFHIYIGQLCRRCVFILGENYQVRLIVEFNISVSLMLDYIK